MSYNRIFLSHKGVDKDTVRGYRDLLTAMGLHPWMDESDVRAGVPLVRTLGEGMADSCAAVFFVTRDYQDTNYLQAEIDDALQQKIARASGFSLITLLIPDEHGTYGQVPDPLKKYACKRIESHLEGVRYILEALPPHLLKTRRYLALPDVVPPAAKEVAILGQNLCTRLWLDEHRYSRALSELRILLSRTSLQALVLIMMTPKALLSIHPEAVHHMKVFSLPRLIQLAHDLPGENRVKVVFHPSATLSLLAVDWTQPERAFALITPKFQRTYVVDDRLSLLLDEREFDAESLTRMLIDAEEGKADASAAPLNQAPALLQRLLNNAGL
jgi:hypothetical protein